MWVKFETVPADGDVLYLPSAFLKIPGKEVGVRFGCGDEVRAAVSFRRERGKSEENSYEHPETVPISYSLLKRLLLPPTLTYQMKIVDSSVVIGPVIGLLLGIHTHLYNPKHMRKYSDRMGIYPQLGGLIYAFSPKSVNWTKHEAFGLFYNLAASEWEYGCFPLPEVIYRRDFHSSPVYIDRLMELTGGRLFNSYRFSKMEMYQYLASDLELKKYLPPTEESLNFEQVMKFIERYRKIILKPVDLSRGRGMCIIEKYDSLYQITDYRYKHQIATVLNGAGALEQFFGLNPDFFHNYLIQQYLSLARIGTSLFDIRVVMQKREDRTWKCSGIECRVSNNSHLTNISRGGYALTLREALEKAFSKDCDALADEIVRCCGSVCESLDGMGHHFAELGLDIAVDEKKAVWLIEANVFPSFKGFKRTDRDTYLSIRYRPLLYALSLTQFGEQNAIDDGGKNEQRLQDHSDG